MSGVSSTSRRGRRRPVGHKLTPNRWEAWGAHLESRNGPPALDDVIPVRRVSALMWPIASGWKGSATEGLVRLLQRLRHQNESHGAGNGVRRSRAVVRRLESWLEETPSDPDAFYGLECVAWCHALPVLASTLPAAPWNELLDRLQSVAADAAGLPLTERPVTQQLLAGELPLTLAYQLPELPACRSLARPAARVLSHGIVELLDGEGWPHARWIDRLAPLLAVWTRSVYLGKALRSGFDRAAWTQYEWLVRQLFRLTRYDGSLALSHDVPPDRTLYEAALAAAGDEDDQQISRAALSGAAADASLPAPAIHSEWASCAVLRRGWERSSDHLTVAYDESLRCELNSANRTLLSGPCDPEIEVDGEILTPTRAWEEVCWVSDGDIDYLELEIGLSQGRTLQRQMLLARDDRFLFMADALLGEHAGDLQYRLALPLTSAVKFAPDAECREGCLVSPARSRVALVLPLALSEWRSEPSPGTLERADDGLVHQLHTRGTRLYAPLFIDLDGKRTRRQRTWRRLTVAQNLQIQPPDMAVGYRVHLGAEQWVIYRSLGSQANRTVLGQNYSSEFVLARFTPSGDSDKLLEIE